MSSVLVNGLTYELVQTSQAASASGGYSFRNISTATTTTVKTGAGTLHSIVVNTTGAGSVTVYDNTAASGTKIATLKASIVEGTYLFDVAFATGLTIVTAAASDVTVTYA
jgi:hypothetical protein